MKKATNCPCGKPLRWSDVGGICSDCRDAALQRTRIRRGKDSRWPAGSESGVEAAAETEEAKTQEPNQ